MPTEGKTLYTDSTSRRGRKGLNPTRAVVVLPAECSLVERKKLRTWRRRCSTFYRSWSRWRRAKRPSSWWRSAATRDLASRGGSAERSSSTWV